VYTTSNSKVSDDVWAVSSDMTLSLALVTGLVLMGVHGQNVRSLRRRQAVPGHVVRAPATIALDWRERLSVQAAARRWDARCKGNTISPIGTQTRNVPRPSAVITLLHPGLDAQTRALGLDVADTAARVALFSCDGAGLGTRRRLVPRLTAIVAETLL